MEVVAPEQWACIDFISDLHLHVQDQATYAAWCSYLQRTQAHALFILGDLFEVWIGDDAIIDPTGFEAACAEQLTRAAQRIPLFLMHGNRDFLMGPALMRTAHATLLDDPSVLVFGGTRWLLSHGDAWCLADTDYQTFRKQVRAAPWQQSFLAKSLAQRQAIAADLRAQSQARKNDPDMVYIDLDGPAVLSALAVHGAHHLIHGHTHRPACHTLGTVHQRWVLSDWDESAPQSRSQVLRMRRPTSVHAHGSITLERIPPAMA